MDATLRLKFNRAVNYVYDYISPGAYEVQLKDGTTRRFDFCESAHLLNYQNPREVSIYLRRIDVTYEDGNKLNMDDIQNIEKFIEFFVGIDEQAELPLYIEEIQSFSFSGLNGMNQHVEYALPPEVIKSANEKKVEDHNI